MIHQHRSESQGIGDEDGGTYRIVSSGLSERADGTTHGFVGHSDEPVGHLSGTHGWSIDARMFFSTPTHLIHAQRLLLAVSTVLGTPVVDLVGELGKPLPGALFVERLFLGGSKDLGEMLGEKPSCKNVRQAMGGEKKATNQAQDWRPLWPSDRPCDSTLVPDEPQPTALIHNRTAQKKASMGRPPM